MLSLVVASGTTLAVVPGLLIAGASIVAPHRFWGDQASVVEVRGRSACSSRALEHRRNNCGASAQLLRSMWNPPGPQMEPVAPALACDSLPRSREGSPIVPYLNETHLLVNIQTRFVYVYMFGGHFYFY